MVRQPTRFETWIGDIGGPQALARKMRVTPTIVRVWMRGDGSPAKSNIEKIKKLSKDRIGYYDLLEHMDRRRR